MGAARAHVLGWSSFVDPTYRRPKHIWLLADYLMRVERGEIKRLIVEMPPRHGKSETTTVKFPAWYLGRHPDRRVIIASHTAELAVRFSARARDTFDSYAPEIWGLSVQAASSAMTRWDIENPEAEPGSPPGGMIAAGVGGPITGTGAHLAIIDDPIKDADQANSRTQRDGLWDWYRFVLRTRLMPNAAVVLVLTRWNEDDVAGRLIRQAQDDPNADQWTILRLPALAEENDQMGRAVGEALWPEQYGVGALTAIQASVGPYVWAALYQQRPQPIGGAIFKREHFRYFREDGDVYILNDGDVVKRVKASDCRRFATVDVAASLSTIADYFVISIYALTPAKDLLHLEQIRVRMEGPDQVPLLERTHQRWRVGYFGIEGVAYQLTLVQSAIRKGLPVRKLDADRDKVARALPAAARVESHSVFFRQGAPWLGALEDELLAFPRGEHDDQVDTLAYAVLELTGADSFLDYMREEVRRREQAKLERQDGDNAR